MLPARHTFRWLFVCLACLAAVGCAKPTVTVDALSAPMGDASPWASYAVMPGMADVRKSDLTFVEYKILLSGVLRELGFTVEEDAKRATATILFSYQSHAVPSSSASGGSTVGIGLGSGCYSGHGGGGSFFGLGLGFPVGGGQPAMPYRHVILLDAVVGGGPGAGTDKTANLWKVTLTADSDENNLRALMPAMLNAARPYIGKDSHGPVGVALGQ